MEPLSASDPRTIGEFTLRARLGSGGMGRVYLGFSPGGRAVAIKVVHPELARDPEFLQRFGREVAAARAVGGMYTAPVVASGLSDDPPWMATAFVPGPPLSDVVTRHGPLPESAVWRLAAGLAEALHAVHACSLVHRDLKPSNVLLAPDGPHVIDFGISRAFEGTVLTSAGMVVGTPGYMSPEQAEGQAAGPPSDVFSLGCVLAYAATGGAPFGAGSAASVLYRVVTAEPDLRLVPDRLRQVISACLGKRPAERTSLSQLTAMISALGPADPQALGSFWPEPLASYVLNDQAVPTPTQVSGPATGDSLPREASSGASPVPGGPVPRGSVPGGSAPGGPVPAAGPAPVSPAQSGWTPPVPAGSWGAAQPGSPSGSPAAGQPVSAAGGQPGFGPTGAFPPGRSAPGTGQPGFGQTGVLQPGLIPPVAGATGHAPMVADGYYAAATRNPALDPSGASWPPQYPGSQQPSWPGSAGGAGGGPSGPGTQYGAAHAGAPWGQTSPAASAAWPQQPGTPAPGPGTPAAWAPGGGPGLPGPLSQYTPGRRNPATSEQPGVIRTAIRLMYAGAAVTVVYVLLGLGAVHHYDLLHEAKLADDAVTAVTGAMIGVACWIVLAMACRRGQGWTRIAGTVLLALHTVGMLIVLTQLSGDVAGEKAVSVVTWVIGLAAVILLWNGQAGAFFRAWRKR